METLAAAMPGRASRQAGGKPGPGRAGRAAGRPGSHLFVPSVAFTDQVTPPPFGSVPSNVAYACSYTWASAPPPTAGNEL